MSFWLLCLAAVSRIVPLRIAYGLIVVAAEGFWRVRREKRAAAIANFAHILGDTAAGRAAAHRSFHNYGRYLVDFVRGVAMPATFEVDKLLFDSWDELDAALAEGRGVILAGIHSGNWDLGGAVLRRRGYPVSVIADTLNNDHLNRFVLRAREQSGLTVIPAENSLRGILRAIRRNELLAILVDRPMAEGGIYVNFFGRPALVPSGPARLALRTGARLIPVALVRAGPNTDAMRVLVDFDLRYLPTGDEEHDVRELTRRMLASHERFIRSHPEQWFMFRPMWPLTSQPVTTEPALAPEG